MKVLITGASSGIGRDLARIYAKKGYNLVLVARDQVKLEKIKGELEKDKVNVETISIDLSNKENCIEIHNSVKDVDILINNAGFGDCGNFTKTDLNKEINMINTNIVAYHILTKLYLIDMKKKGKGKILNVASIAGFMPGPLMATYYATKSYVIRLSEAIREELVKEKSKVQISVLCPGPVKTNFSKVAGVNFGMQSLSSEYVAKYTTKKMLKGKFIIVPGFTMRVIRFLTKITPNWLVSKISYKINYTKSK